MLLKPLTDKKKLKNLYSIKISFFFNIFCWTKLNWFFIMYVTQILKDKQIRSIQKYLGSVEYAWSCGEKVNFFSKIKKK